MEAEAEEEDEERQKELERLQFKAETAQMNGKEVRIQLTFEHQGQLSQSTFGKDKLRLKLATGGLLRSGETAMGVSSEFEYEMNVYPKHFDADAEAAMGVGVTTLGVLEGSSLIMGILSGGGLKKVWSMLNTF